MASSAALSAAALQPSSYSSSSSSSISTSVSQQQQRPQHFSASSAEPTAAEPTCSNRTICNSILAGYAAGICGTIVGHPLDSAKVWLQTQSNGHAANTINASNIHPSAATSTARTVYNIKTGTTNIVPASITNRSMSTLASSTTASASASSVTSSVTSSAVSRYASTVRALYKGIGGPLVAVGMVQSINFAVYDSCRRMLYSYDMQKLQQQQQQVGSSTAFTANLDHSNYLNHDSLYNVAASSMVAGSILACFTSPMLIVKTQQQVFGHSFRHAALQMIRPDASGPLQFRNMFVGFSVHTFSEVVGRAVYFCTYEYLKRNMLVYRQAQDPNLETVSLQDRMASAAMSGILCWAAIFPIDAVRCRLYAERPALSTAASTSTIAGGVSSTAVRTGNLTAVQMARHMWQQGGWRSFYRGFGVTVLRAGPVAAAVLPIYDLALEQLSAMD
jgi:hypothetical protein